MTASAFNLVDFDDGPTLVQPSPVFHTAVMDRRQMPQPVSGVMPVSRPAPSVRPRPQSSPDFTQPALRVRRDIAGTRRMVGYLAIGVAFLFGLAGAYGFQTLDAREAPAPLAARAPRSVTARSSTLATKSTPDALPRTEEADPPRATPTATARRMAAVAPVTTVAAEEEPAPPADEALDGRDLLGEGLAP